MTKSVVRLVILLLALGANTFAQRTPGAPGRIGPALPERGGAGIGQAIGRAEPDSAYSCCWEQSEYERMCSDYCQWQGCTCDHWECDVYDEQTCLGFFEWWCSC